MSSRPEGIPVISGPDVDKAIALRDSRYTGRQLEESEYQIGESPDEYVARLLELYPGDDQRAYILGLNAVIPIGLSSLEATAGYMQDQELNPEIEEFFPRSLNSLAVGAQISDENDWYLRLDPDVANPAISAANLAEAALRRAADQQLSEARRASVDFILGRSGVKGAGLSAQVRLGIRRVKVGIAKGVIGEDQLEEHVVRQIGKLVNLRTLGITLDRSAERFRNISKNLSGSFDPLEIYLDAVAAQLSLDDLVIHPSVGSGLFEAHALNS